MQWILSNKLKLATYLGYLCLGGLSFIILIIILAWPKSKLNYYAPSVLLLDSNQNFLAQFETHFMSVPIGYGYWEHESLPKRFVDATLALEDRDFYGHWGVDFSAIVRALWQNLSNAERISGASTITMQVVRGQNPSRRTYWNKLLEASAALIMTTRYSRDEVLTQYLKIVPYSNQIHGAQYAAQKYFNKSSDDLSWAQIAFLAAIPQNPPRMNPLKYTSRQRAIKRGKAILLYLHEQKLIDEVQYKLAVIQIEQILPPAEQKRPLEAMHAILHVQKKLNNNQIKLEQLDQLNPLLISSFDLDIAKAVDKITAKYMSWWRVKGASNAAIIVLDQKTLEVKAWMGSDDYFNDNQYGKIDYTQVKRSPGSTLKPHIFAMALDNELITPATVIDDLPNSHTLIRNADYQFLGPMLPRQALANSRNVPVVNLTNKIGLSNVYSFLSELELHQNIQPASYYGNAIAIGSMPVTLEELINSYSIYSQSGVYRPLKWFSWQKNSETEIIKPQTSALINLFLSDPSARLPTFPRMGTSEYPYAVAVKTGTSQHFRDAWTVAYSKHYIVAAWVGHANMTGMDRLSGSGSAAVLVKDILLSLQPQTLSKADQFLAPKDYQLIGLCSLSGLLSSDNCPKKTQEWLAVNQIPTRSDNSFEKVSDNKGGQSIKINLPARYDLWLASHQQYSDVSLNQNKESITKRFLSDQSVIVFDIKQPKDKTILIINPEMPVSMRVTQLNVLVSPRIEQVVWYVNSQVYKTARYPYTINFDLKEGEYNIQVGVPNSPERSKVHRLRVIQ
ncbi:MAG: transglycosylase domain-containing protein [Saccharospirillaceae bacterium]|nr:transglycosylase domain-containing protein [Pseudomonadales bacterium]NRB78449.1 transglycosylase domain-containing protein [Saccharospirillaceae bacterium]